MVVIFMLAKRNANNSLFFDMTKDLLSQLKHDYPELSENWRFLLLYFRACCDKLVLERIKFEEILIEDAKYHLKNFDLEKRCSRNLPKSPFFSFLLRFPRL